jgi:hypothetical protein
MSTLLHRVARLAASMLLVLCASCGGGGGGDGAESGSRPGAGQSPSNDPSSGIFLLSAANIRDVTYEGNPPHTESLVIGYSGQLSTLSGATIYAFIDMPHPLYTANEPPLPVYRQPAVSLNLYGNPLHTLPPGNYTGTMKVFACLDPQCASQLPNSPLLIPYDVTIKPGFRFSPERLQVQSPYGSLPRQTVLITPPEGSMGWIELPGNVPSGASSASFLLMRDWFRRVNDTFVFAVHSAVPADTYAMDFTFNTVVPDPRYPDQRQVVNTAYHVSYTVMATAPFAMSPASASATATLSLGGLPAGWPEIELHSQVSGGTFERRGVRIDEFPAAAVGNPLLPNWLAHYQSQNLGLFAPSVAYCDFFTGECLPIGVYKGALLFRHTSVTGEISDFEFPVTLTLVP